jgi:O-antigen ligase
MLTAKNMAIRILWIFAMLIMGLTLFKTASRAGFIDLMISGTVVLWHFGVRGKRLALLVGTGVAAAFLLVVAGGPLIVRMEAVAGRGNTQEEAKAFESLEQRKYLMFRALDCIEHYPIFGVGAHNFMVYSGVWHDVHMTYLQIASEGGIPCLILYILFFARAFSNLRKLRRRKDLDVHTTLFVGGLHSSMIGFVVGALFAPEAYQFFPYFSVAYTSALVATIAEQESTPELVADRSGVQNRFGGWRVNSRTGAVPVIR